MKFDQIIEPNAQIKGLERSVYSGNIIQSLIISGEKGTGKKTLAKIYATALVCMTNTNKPCGMCKGCLLVKSDNHPDIYIIDGKNKKTIGVETIKDMQKQAIIKPNENMSKVFIINDAHTLTPQAQNAMLKLIEEPPSYLSVILICQNTVPILDTILSRCTTISMPYLSYENIVQALVEKGIERSKAKICAFGAGGSLGKAYDRCVDEEYLVQRDKFIDIFFLLSDNKTKAYQMILKHKPVAREMICFWQSIVRDCIMKKSNEIENIENIDKIKEIEKFTNEKSQETLVKILEALCDAEMRIHFNAQYLLVIDNLLTQI